LLCWNKAMKDKMIKKRFSKNLMAWPDITAFCLDLRKSFLKSKYSSMDDRQPFDKEANCRNCSE